MPDVLVTGANGLLATNVIMELLTNGYKVRGLLRNRNKFMAPGHKNLEIREGDISDPRALDDHTQGVEHIIHVAAITAHHLTNYTTYRQVNAEATEQLLKAGLNHGVKKFLYVSSANAFGFGDLARPGNETTPIRPPFSGSFYAQSKLEGQQRVMKYSDKLHVTVVNPTFMIGPYDGKPSSGQIIRMGYRKKIIFCPPGGKNFVNATDAAKGVVAALEKGKNGEAYLLAGENLTYKEFFRKMSDITSNRAVYITLPAFVLYLAGYIGNILQKSGIKTPLSLTNMKMLCVRNFYSNHKARKELNLEFGDIEEGIRQAIRWFKQNKMLK
ncbi:MAG: NAD-dependent epimerase/dehydratase family protein [Marinilabilia sp.]